MLSNNLLDSNAQKAFIKGINGCIEHTFVMNELLANARQKTNTIHVTFFDLADAFGSVEHNLIHHTLQRNGIWSSICDYVENLYSRLQGQIKGPGWLSTPFDFKRGVFQGDPLSPIIFLMVFNLSSSTLNPWKIDMVTILMVLSILLCHLLTTFV